MCLTVDKPNRDDEGFRGGLCNISRALTSGIYSSVSLGDMRCNMVSGGLHRCHWHVVINLQNAICGAYKPAEGGFCSGTLVVFAVYQTVTCGVSTDDLQCRQLLWLVTSVIAM